MDRDRTYNDIQSLLGTLLEAWFLATTTITLDFVERLAERAYNLYH
jgi:hypothetical protein